MNTPDEKHREQDSTLRFISNVTFGFTKAERKASSRLTLWTFCWAFTVFLIVYAIRNLSLSEPVAWIAITIPSLGFLAIIRSYILFLRIADELTVKIHMEACALTVGASLFILTGYSLAELSGAPQLGTANAFAIIGVSLGIAQFFSAWRYR